MADSVVGRPSTLEEAELQRVLDALFAFTGTRTSGRSSLDAMAAGLCLLGNPHENLRTIHVAGTSGKTSTCYYIRALLEASGCRTGLTVSPHIVSLNERVQVAGLPLRVDLFCTYANRMLDKLSPLHGKLTYFELMICLALWVFSLENCEYCIVEVGIGGTRDATNVLAEDNKVAVIGPIGLDHTEKLGTSISQIAAHKAGIIPSHGVVFVANQSHEALDVIHAKSIEVGSQVVVVDDTSSSTHGSPHTGLQIPEYQYRNWNLALATVTYLSNRDGFTLPTTRFKELMLVAPPARFEWFQVGEHRILLDGAHNPQKMAALVDSIQVQGLPPLPTLATLTQAPDPKISQTISILAPIVSHLIIPEFVLGHDDKIKASVPASQVAAVAQAQGIPTEIIPDLNLAVHTLLQDPSPTLLVTGSLYLAALVSPLLT